MRISKLKKFERSPVVVIPADTPEETAAFIAELVAIGEKMPSGSDSGEKLADILADFKKPRQTVVNDVKGKRIRVSGGVITEIGSSETTKNDSSERTKNDSSINTVFDADELLILEQLKNGTNGN